LLAYNLVIILVAFALLRFLVVRETRNSLLQTQIGEYRAGIEQYAVEAESCLRNSDGEGLYRLAQTWSEELGGRILISDAAGVIQADAFSAYNGVQLQLTDLTEVLNGRSSFSYSYYWLEPASPRPALLSSKILERLRISMSSDDPSQ